MIFASACGGGGGSSGCCEVQLYVGDLFFPVKLAFSDDNRMFFTELSSGNIRIVENDALLETPFATLPVAGEGNEGLTGIVFDPEFSSNQYVYVFNTLPEPLRSRVVRFKAEGNIGIEPSIIIDNLPAGGHNGGPLVFGNDGKLYVSVGDAFDPKLAQDPTSLGGKILRLNSDGSIPSDNPDPNSPVFASGFRNVFGMDVLRSSGEIFVSENGPDCDDELNILIPGGNYGWREGQECGDTDSRFQAPIAVFNPSIGPTGLHFYNGQRVGSAVGSLLWGEFNTGVIRIFRILNQPGLSNNALVDSGTLVDGSLGSVLGITEDKDGRIYFTTTDAIYRLG
jgi:glucose/arabinose dehydrogenase